MRAEKRFVCHAIRTTGGFRKREDREGPDWAGPDWNESRPKISEIQPKIRR